MTAREERQVGVPQPGLFRLRLAKGAPFVAARIVHEPSRDPEDGSILDRSPLWRGDINGEIDPNPSPAPTEAVWRIWLHGDPIDEAEFTYLSKDAEWARQHAPDDPRARPREKADLRQMKVLL